MPGMQAGHTFHQPSQAPQLQGTPLPQTPLPPHLVDLVVKALLRLFPARRGGALLPRHVDLDAGAVQRGVGAHQGQVGQPVPHQQHSQVGRGGGVGRGLDAIQIHRIPGLLLQREGMVPTQLQRVVGAQPHVLVLGQIPTLEPDLLACTGWAVGGCCWSGVQQAAW